MNITTIIQARMGSSRLPGKVLRLLKDRSVLGHVITRSKTIPSVSNVVVATSNLERDDAIATEAEKYGVFCYRGSENNVLSRYYEAAKLAKAEVIIRVTSDCPLLDPATTEKLIQEFVSGGYDYARVKLANSYPRGLDSEILTFAALEQAYEQAETDYDKEHVTPFIYRHPEIFHIHTMVNEKDESQYRLTLDTPEDWELILRIYNHLYKGTVFGWDETLELLKMHPEWVRINANVEQAHSGE
ncbi:glycosyltransferase family protein [Paenibacillus sp. M1]|uniref:Glycosyltransferase family protein n=1 Tax=Paenibacillus haidiansis TaxID=1574488 RepID=A0ABU7VWF0_9BACL